MKLLPITALALCLNISFLHANDDEDQPWGRFGKQSSIGLYSSVIVAGSAFTIVGMKKIYSAAKSLNTPETLIESNTSANQRTVHDNIFKGLHAIAMGVSFATIGYCFMINGFVNEVESLKDN